MSLRTAAPAADAFVSVVKAAPSFTNCSPTLTAKYDFAIATVKAAARSSAARRDQDAVTQGTPAVSYVRGTTTAIASNSAARIAPWVSASVETADCRSLATDKDVKRLTGRHRDNGIDTTAAPVVLVVAVIAA